MKRTLLLLSFLFFLAFRAIAQSNNPDFKLGVGLSFGGALPPQSETTPITGGFILGLESRINSKLGLVFKTGFSFYTASDLSLGSYDEYDDSYGPVTGTVSSFIPFEVGAKFYIAEGLYIEGDGGVSFYLNFHPGGNKLIAPVVSPGLGYNIPFKGSKNTLDLGFNYEDRIYNATPITDFSQIAFHATFYFGL